MPGLRPSKCQAEHRFRNTPRATGGLLRGERIQVETRAPDRSCLYVACNTQTFGVGTVTHSAQFFNGDVVTLALLHTGISQITDREEDNYDHGPELNDF